MAKQKLLIAHVGIYKPLRDCNSDDIHEPRTEWSDMRVYNGSGYRISAEWGQKERASDPTTLLHYQLKTKNGIFNIPAEEIEIRKRGSDYKITIPTTNMREFIDILNANRSLNINSIKEGLSRVLVSNEIEKRENYSFISTFENKIKSELDERICLKDIQPLLSFDKDHLAFNCGIPLSNKRNVKLGSKRFFLGKRLEYDVANFEADYDSIRFNLKETDNKDVHVYITEVGDPAYAYE